MAASRTPRVTSMKEMLQEKKEKMIDLGQRLRRGDSSASKKSLDANALSKQEVAELMDHLKTIIIHLRARIEYERSIATTSIEADEKMHLFDTATTKGDGGDVSLAVSRTVSDARAIITIAQTGNKNLVDALRTFGLLALAAIVRLAFQASELPLIDNCVCAEVFVLHENAQKQGQSIDVDDLRAALGKAKARSIDILGQLIALLSKDVLNRTRLAYTWGPLIFMPRFDGKNTTLAAEYRNFDICKMSIMVNAVTKQMIDEHVDIFSLEDDEAIEKYAVEIHEAYNMQVNAARISVTPSAASSSSLRDSSSNRSDNVRLSSSFHRSGQFAPPKLEKCVVGFDFEKESVLEMTVERDQILEVLDKGDDGWWKVRSEDGTEGLVPANYVEILEEEEEDSRMPPPPPPPPQHYDYQDDAEPIQEVYSAHDMDEYHQQQFDCPAEENVNEQGGDVIEAKIVQMQLELNKLQQLKHTKSRCSSQDSNGTGHSSQEENYQSPSQRSGPPPLPPTKTGTPRTPAMPVRPSPSPSNSFKGPPSPIRAPQSPSMRNEFEAALEKRRLSRRNEQDA